MDSNDAKGILEARIKQMAEGGCSDNGFSLDDFDPKPEEETPAKKAKEETASEKKTGKQKKYANRSEGSPLVIDRKLDSNTVLMDVEEYGRRFLMNRPYDFRVSFSMNRTTLDILRRVLYDLESRTTLSSFIENILLDHLQTYRTLINEATVEKIRKPTIPNL